GRLFSYARTDGDGSLVFTTTATVSQLADTIRKLPSGDLEYRMGKGSVMQFDSTGRMTAMRDRNGNTTMLQYTGGNLTSVTDPVGRSITLEYSDSQISRITDPLGRSWQYGYAGGNSQLTSVTDPVGNVTRYGYDDRGRLTSITDPRGNPMKLVSYDGNGRVIRQRFADGGTETYAYTLSGTIVTGVTMTDPMGRVMTRRFDARGYTLEATDGLGQSSVISRDMNTSLSTGSTGPCGCTQAIRTFDDRGNPLPGTNLWNQTARMKYEPVFNKVAKVTDSLGRISLFSYDSRGTLHRPPMRSIKRRPLSTTQTA